MFGLYDLLIKLKKEHILAIDGEDHEGYENDASFRSLFPVL